VSETGRPDNARRVTLRHIRLTHFRNYRAQALDFSGAHVVLTGHNGAGKTNLLEAVSFLSPGRGLRRAAYNDVTSVQENQEGSGFSIHARLFSAAYGEAHIGTGVMPAAPGEGGRKIRINSAAGAADQLLDYCRIVWLVPAMDGLFTGSGSERRRFLDRMVLAIDPLHGRRALDYEKAMRARNRLLVEGNGDPRWLEALEVQMAELGTAIAAARVEMVRLLQAVIEHIPVAGGFPRADLALAGTVEKAVGLMAAVDAEEHFRALLKQGRGSDGRAGRTLEGPHRSDLQVRHAEKAMPAGLCSTGEQKALLTGLVLSHARLTADLSAMTPILLLDEIAAHLDTVRRRALFDILDELGAQAFMTGTDAALFKDLQGRAEFFTVEGGMAARAGPSVSLQ